MIGTGPYHVIVTAMIGNGPYHVIVTAVIDHDRDWFLPCYNDRCDR